MNSTKASTNQSLIAESREPRKLLFVGGLSQAITETDLYNHFSQLCQVEAVKIAADRKSHQSKGYAILTLGCSDQVDQMATLPHVICGRRVDCQRAARNKEKQRWKDELKRKKLFINNLPNDCTSEELETLFGQYGEVRCSYIIKDFVTGEPKGYGFVEYVTEADASATLGRSIELKGNLLILSPYLYKYEQRKVKETLDSPSTTDNMAKLNSPRPTSAQSRDSAGASSFDKEERKKRWNEVISTGRYAIEDESNYVFRVGNGIIARPISNISQTKQNLSRPKKQGKNATTPTTTSSAKRSHQGSSFDLFRGNFDRKPPTWSSTQNIRK